MFAVVGSLAALTSARETGRGQEVDVAIYEAVAALMESTMADYELAGITRSRSGSVLPGVAPSNVYPTADGGEIVIAGNADRVFTRLCGAMGRPELAIDERYATHLARGTNMVELDELIGAWTATMPTAELLVRAGAPRRTGRADLHRQGNAERPALPRPGHGATGADRQGGSVPTTGIVPRFTDTPGRVRHGGARLGEHTDVVLRDLLGLDDATIADLHRDHIVEVNDA